MAPSLVARAKDTKIPSLEFLALIALRSFIVLYLFWVPVSSRLIPAPLNVPASRSGWHGRVCVTRP